MALAAVHTSSTVLRDSDVAHRGAAILDPLTGMLNRMALTNRAALYTAKAGGRDRVDIDDGAARDLVTVPH